VDEVEDSSEKVCADYPSLLRLVARNSGAFQSGCFLMADIYNTVFQSSQDKVKQCNKTLDASESDKDLGVNPRVLCPPRKVARPDSRIRCRK